MKSTLSTSDAVSRSEATLGNELGMAGQARVSTFLWGPSPAALTLGNDEVHVWSTSLNPPPEEIEKLEETLARDERARADRFHFQKDRRRFIVARGMLRAILGRYLGREPSGLRFCYTAHGKPELAAQSGDDTLRFNVSHSHELALYGVTRGREIGVDVEYVRPVAEVEDIAERFFSPRENAVLCALPAHEKAGAFFACWTRKEAYLKALGDGLARPLDAFDVSLIPGEPARLLHVQGDEQERYRWLLRELTPAEGYTAAICVEGDGWHLECWYWVSARLPHISMYDRVP